MATSLPLLSVLLLSFVVASSLFVSVRSAVASDEITSLPGWTGALPSKHYSGYFPTTLDGSSAGQLHYWLTLSEGSPATDPLVLWLQGGPGCSSLFGLLYENGQLHFSGETANSSSDSGTAIPALVQNPYAWTKVANMLWLEQPIGVGFSFCIPGHTGDCSGNNWGLDAYRFFVNFFKGYPELSKLPFHITGESWAGVYIPSVADAIITGNQAGQNPLINLKGLAIGNGVGGDADDAEQDRREFDFWYGHGGISYPAAQSVWAKCGAAGNVSQDCRTAIQQAERTIGPFYIYNIYDTCPHDLEAVSVAELSDSQKAQLGLPIFAPLDFAGQSNLRDLGFVCVLESVSSDFLNAKEVQQALHVTVANVSTWGPCGNTDKRGRHATMAHRAYMAGLGLPGQSLGDLYKKLIPEVPILIYSGDVDQCVPYYYSDNWVRKMGFPVAESWQPWMYGDSGNRQVGGYVTYYSGANNLTFLTVKNSGHMVPQYAPEAALYMFTTYLRGGKY